MSSYNFEEHYNLHPGTLSLEIEAEKSELNKNLKKLVLKGGYQSQFSLSNWNDHGQLTKNLS